MGSRSSIELSGTNLCGKSISIRNNLGSDRSKVSGSFKTGGSADSEVTKEKVNSGI